MHEVQIEKQNKNLNFILENSNKYVVIVETVTIDKTIRHNKELDRNAIG